MYAYTSDSFRYVGNSGTPMPGEQLGEDVPPEVLKAIAKKEAIWRRDSILRASAWTQMDSGLPADKVQEWLEYRSLLLALTDDPDFPDVEWPMEPSI